MNQIINFCDFIKSYSDSAAVGGIPVEQGIGIGGSILYPADVKEKSAKIRKLLFYCFHNFINKYRILLIIL